MIDIKALKPGDVIVNAVSGTAHTVIYLGEVPVAVRACSVTNPAEWALVPDADHFLRKLEAKLVGYNVYFAGELVQAIKDLENDPCGRTLKQLHKATCKIICNGL